MSWLSDYRLAVALALASSCASYNAPPDATLLQPDGGAFAEGDLVHLEFTEAVAVDSVAIRLWPNARDIENEFQAGVEPVIEMCKPGEMCGDLGVGIASDRKSLTLTFGPALGKPGSPYVIELLPGVRDAQGSETGSSQFFDMQFKASGKENAVPIEFDDGVYIILAQVDEPIPTVLTLVSDIRILDSGEFALAGAEGDEIDGAAKNTRDPEELFIDETNQGWTGYATGFVNLTEDGKRLLETEPFDLILPVGPLEVHLDTVRLFAEVVKNPETGIDRLDGTLSFDKLTLVNGANSSEQAGGATALIADFVPPEIVPAGTPQICGDLCGLVVDGFCDPPDAFPPPGFCTDPE